MSHRAVRHAPEENDDSCTAKLANAVDGRNPAPL